jgi:hypothetical protein
MSPYLVSYNSISYSLYGIKPSSVIILYDVRFHVVNLVLSTLLISIPNIIMVQQEFPLVAARQEQNNATATEMNNTRDRIIPQAQEVNDSNLELIKICTGSPSSECDNTMIIIHNDCVAYPSYVAAHIPSCDDSRLISYLLARGLLE